MRTYSTTEAARKLKLHRVTLQRHIDAGKLSAPPLGAVGGVKVRLWTGRDIERVRKQLAKIKNGRRKKKQRK